MRRRLVTLALSALLAGLAGCAVPSVSPHPVLEHPDAPTTETRLLTIEPESAPDERQQLLSVLKLKDHSLTVVVATPTGQRLFTLKDDQNGARFTQTLTDPPFPASWLASRLEWSLWPLDALNTAWLGSDWSAVETPQDSGRVRRIQEGDETVATIRYQNDRLISNAPVTLEDHQTRHRITIAPLSERSP
ncbi:DUF3261 domain-containing protein [Larsenimonas salina]|uniref:DUF3261 domain-containing protein n=1 Tax=Larsenimonas salina TaxID=1295565 RepID=UPI0020737922|nr:DUF3261 domain-containing protein [Larsenimonas salina]MCM5705014.1 DUF3261 domain-containing protein [Larsenimonas salina]